eukprot:2005504-Pleurochrysis_carterae.AAC.1
MKERGISALDARNSSSSIGMLVSGSPMDRCSADSRWESLLILIPPFIGDGQLSAFAFSFTL